MDLRKQAANLLTLCRLLGSLGLLALPVCLLATAAALWEGKALRGQSRT